MAHFIVQGIVFVADLMNGANQISSIADESNDEKRDLEYQSKEESSSVNVKAESFSSNETKNHEVEKLNAELEQLRMELEQKNQQLENAQTLIEALFEQKNQLGDQLKETHFCVETQTKLILGFDAGRIELEDEINKLDEKLDLKETENQQLKEALVGALEDQKAFQTACEEKQALHEKLHEAKMKVDEVNKNVQKLEMMIDEQVRKIGALEKDINQMKEKEEQMLKARMDLLGMTVNDLIVIHGKLSTILEKVKHVYDDKNMEAFKAIEDILNTVDDDLKRFPTKICSSDVNENERSTSENGKPLQSDEQIETTKLHDDGSFPDDYRSMVSTDGGALHVKSVDHELTSSYLGDENESSDTGYESMNETHEEENVKTSPGHKIIKLNPEAEEKPSNHIMTDQNSEAGKEVISTLLGLFSTGISFILFLTLLFFFFSWWINGVLIPIRVIKNVSYDSTPPL